MKIILKTIFIFHMFLKSFFTSSFKDKDEELVGVEMIRTEMDPGSMKKFPPLDNSNINYEELLRSRKLQSSKVNYVSSNIVSGYIIVQLIFRSLFFTM